jgi:hypothetical protein
MKSWKNKKGRDKLTFFWDHQTGPLSDRGSQPVIKNNEPYSLDAYFDFLEEVRPPCRDLTKKRVVYQDVFTLI